MKNKLKNTDQQKERLNYREINSIDLFKENNSTLRYEFFRHKKLILFQGDSLNENLFNNKFIDLIVTSPPYNVGIEYNSNNDELNYEQYLQFSEKWMRNCYKWSKTQARFILNIPLDKSKGGQKSVGADLTKIAQKPACRQTGLVGNIIPQ